MTILETVPFNVVVYSEFAGKAGFQLRATYHRDISKYIKPKFDIVSEWCSLSTEGVLTGRHGYAWDGGSSPFSKLPLVGSWTKTKTTIQNSLVHDMLYQLIRLGLLSDEFKEPADQLLRDIGIEDGMYRWRANAWYNAVAKFGSPATHSHAEPKILVLPEHMSHLLEAV